MKMTIFLLTMLLASIHFASAQRNPLKGSGNLVNKTLDLTHFNTVELLDLDGEIEIAAGKPFDIAVSIDDNLADLLDATVTGGTLTVKLKGNLNNRLYIEETNIHIKISLPQLESVFHRSNGKLTVNGLAGKNFIIKNTGNGSAFLNGAIDELEVVCRDNGSVYADNLAVKTINAKRSGNGNIYVNAVSKINAQSSGNGSVIVVERKGKDDAKMQSKAPRILSSIQNLSAATVYLSVKYPVKGAYSISIKSNETVKEYFPTGTTIYKGNQFTTFKSPVIVITEKNRQDTFVVK